jgi:hypothetical protein
MQLKMKLESFPYLIRFQFSYQITYVSASRASRKGQYLVYPQSLCDELFATDLRHRRKETMDNAIMIHKAGNSTKSRYGVNTLNPIAPSKITRIGVKQHRATKTVPANAAIIPFFDG